MTPEIQEKLDELATTVAHLSKKLDYDGDGTVEVEDLTKWTSANPKKAVAIALAVMVVIAIVL